MKKSLLLINIGLLIASSSLASTLFPKFKIDKLQPKAAEQRIIKSHDGYANFSGHWMGTCDEDPEEEEMMLIEQSSDDNSIVIDHMEFPIDAITTHGSQENFVTGTSFQHLHWSKDGQQLLSSGVVYIKAGHLSQEGLDLIVFNSSLSMENEQLVSIFSYSDFKDGTLKKQDSYRCVYKKIY
jgi:hypothetical protein